MYVTRAARPRAKHLTDRVGLATGGVNAQLPSINAVPQKMNRGPHGAPLLIREPYGITRRENSASTPNFTMRLRLQGRLDGLTASALCKWHPMSSAKVQVEKRRKTHKIQTWVSPEMKEALESLATNEGRTVANLVRRELSKITGIPE
jgi:hypothetical protein